MTAPDVSTLDDLDTPQPPILGRGLVWSDLVAEMDEEVRGG